MNKIFKILILFFLVYLSVFLLSLICKSSLVLTVVLCIGLTVLFFVFGERKKACFTDIRKGALMLLFFLASTLSVSLFSGLVFKTETFERSLYITTMSVFLVPVCEELFYRATLFSSLDRVFPTSVSILLSSLVFSIAHTGLSAMLTAFFAGVLLSLIYKKRGMVLTVLCHMANNLIAALVTVPRVFQPMAAVLLLIAAVSLFFSLRKDFLLNE